MNLSLGNLDAAMPPAIAPKAAATAAAAALRKPMDASVRGSRRFGCWLSTAGVTSEAKQQLADGAGRRPRRVRIGGELRVHRIASGALAYSGEKNQTRSINPPTTW